MIHITIQNMSYIPYPDRNLLTYDKAPFYNNKTRLSFILNLEKPRCIRYNNQVLRLHTIKEAFL